MLGRSSLLLAASKKRTRIPVGTTAAPVERQHTRRPNGAHPAGWRPKRESAARLLRQATAEVTAAAMAGGAAQSSSQDGSAVTRVSSPSHSAAREKVTDDAFNQLLGSFRAMTAPFSDLDEVLGVASHSDEMNAVRGGEAAEGTACVVCKRLPSTVTSSGFSASLVCPKKFYLLSARRDLEPGSSMGEAVRLDDSVGFNELARRWDRLQFGSKAILIAEGDHDAAVQKTEKVIVDYFTHQYASLGEQAPTLTLHRPAFSAPLPKPGGAPGDLALTLRARPSIVRYRPKENQWVILESQAVLDPLSSSTRAAAILQRIHFTTLTLRRSLSQEHIPIAVRKRFLDVDPKMLTEASLNEGKALFSGARPMAPIDVKRSGLLHIRQYLPGPVTLMDCEPTRLVKFVQRVSLEDLLDADRQTYAKAVGDKDGRGRGRGKGGQHSGACTGAFDIQHIDDLDPSVTPYYNAMVAAMKTSGRPTNARSARSLKVRETEEHQLFEAQQQLMESLLVHHTLKVAEQSRDAQQVARWTAFSKDDPDGLATSTWDARSGDMPTAPTVGGSRKRGARDGRHGEVSAAAASSPPVPCFSENIGGHCSRGDGCPFFSEGFCLPQRYPEPVLAQDNHLFTTPSTAVAKKTAWWMAGNRTVRDVLYQHKSGAIKLTAPQLRYVKAVSQGQVAVCAKEVDAFFSKLRYPLFIIDFEAVQFALPPFEKVVAYQSVPFQFSIDVFQHDVFTETPTHYDYLHFGPGYSPNVDPRPGCVKELLRIVRLEREKKRLEMLKSGQLDALREAESAAADGASRTSKGKRGERRKAASAPRAGRTATVEGPENPWDGSFLAHFASFEKSCLEKLGQLETDFKDEIKHFYFVDSLELFKRGFVHPNANGSNSLKKLLPAICPDFQYGVFGVESGSKDDLSADDGTQVDEQKGENALAVFRLWYHQEGGGTLQDLQRASGRTVAGTALGLKGTSTAKAMQHIDGARAAQPLPLPDTREDVWARLRIQLLEYCSLDTKALYEIMREVKREREAVRDLKPEDKSGWVFHEPIIREIHY